MSDTYIGALKNYLSNTGIGRFITTKRKEGYGAAIRQDARDTGRHLLSYIRHIAPEAFQSPEVTDAMLEARVSDGKKPEEKPEEEPNIAANLDDEQFLRAMKVERCYPSSQRR